jgi:hypothetical protein
MTTRNANAPTTMIDEKMAKNVINEWYLYVYLILVIDSLVAMRDMKRTSCWLGKAERERGGGMSEFGANHGDEECSTMTTKG